MCGFIRQQAAPGTAIALLGDIFEYWVGDDHDTPVGNALADACRHAGTKGAQVCFMHGNRDFLVGADYLARCQAQLLPDPWYGVLFGIPTTLSHGDLLCTDDAPYQQFRRMSRSKEWQTAFLAKPLSDRVAYAQHLRAESIKNKASATHSDIMDVNPQAVTHALSGQWPGGADSTPASMRLIHGHTHRPARHEVASPAGAERWVLPDWDMDDNHNPRGYALQVSADGIQKIAAGV